MSEPPVEKLNQALTTWRRLLEQAGDATLAFVDELIAYSNAGGDALDYLTVLGPYASMMHATAQIAVCRITERVRKCSDKAAQQALANRGFELARMADYLGLVSSRADVIRDAQTQLREEGERE